MAKTGPEKLATEEEKKAAGVVTPPKTEAFIRRIEEAYILGELKLSRAEAEWVVSTLDAFDNDYRIEAATLGNIEIERKSVAHDYIVIELSDLDDVIHTLGQGTIEQLRELLETRLETKSVTGEKK